MTQDLKKNGIAVWAITPGGLDQGKKLAAGLGTADFYVSSGIAKSYRVPLKAKLFQRLSGHIYRVFNAYSGHIFLFSTGIAVRLVAPLLKSKLEDPAVVVMDDRACHAISLVSGHLGGGNDLAFEVARITGAKPVITTATDVNRLPSIDMIAKSQGLVIETPDVIKSINMAFLKGETIRVTDPFSMVLPNLPESILYKDSGKSAHDRYEVFCSDEIRSVSRETLVLRPRSLVVGIGCNRGTSCKETASFLELVFKEHGLSQKSISCFATTEIKNDEEGLLQLAEILKIKIKFYNKESLNSVETILNPSEMVEKHMGVKSVCEAAAILGSNNGNLILEKMKQGNVTLAVARGEPPFL